MAVSIFDNKAVTPDNSMVADALNESHSMWIKLQDHVRENYPVVTGVWKHYGKSSGWVYKLLSNKRTLLFFIPQKRCFRLRFGVSEKAAAVIETAALPEEIKEAVRTATPYPEGRSVDLDISQNEVKLTAYVKDRRMVSIGTITGNQLELLKTLVKITNQG